MWTAARSELKPMRATEEAKQKVLTDSVIAWLFRNVFGNSLKRTEKRSPKLSSRLRLT